MNFFRSLRFRLALWFLLTLVVPLLLFGTAAYFLLSYELNRTMDESLESRAVEIQRTISVEDGGIKFDQKFNELVLVYDATGKLLQTLGPNVALSNPEPLVARALLGDSDFATATTSDGQPVRFYVTPYTADAKTWMAIVVGKPLSEIAELLATYLRILALSAITLFVLTALSGMLLTNRTMRPIDWITGLTQEIGEKNLDRRIHVQGQDEVGRLAKSLNAMMERLEIAFKRQKQFSADASHELRTPLAIIEAESSLALDRDRTPEEYRKSLETVSQEAAHMASIINKLLFLVRTDAQKEPPTFQTIDLQNLVADVAADVEVLARDKGVDFKTGEMDGAVVKGDTGLLRQLFLNIMENAVKYTPEGGTVTSALTRQNGSAIITVTDTGIGIPPEHLPFIFERFYRVDKARSRAEGGSGLGLAIAKNIAEAHGGKIEVASREHEGSTFTITLPVTEN